MTPLLELPLFLGMSEAELSSYREEGLFSVGTLTRGTEIACRGDKVESLLVLTDGTVRCSTVADDGSYRMDELLHAPLLLQPECLFGMRQRYTTTYVATTACNIVAIRKMDVVTMMNRSIVFRINFLNAITTTAQRINAQTWHQQSADIPQRIIRFIKDRTQYPAGHKRLYINMVDLARELGCSRLEVSEALHLLEDRELIIMHRSSIEIPMMQMLLAYTK